MAGQKKGYQQIEGLRPGVKVEASGRVVARHKKGRNPEDPNRTKKYFHGPDAIKMATAYLDSLPDRRKQRTITTNTFHDLANGYLKASVGTMAESCQETTYLKLQASILPILGKLQASRVTPAKLDNYVATRAGQTVKINTGGCKIRGAGKRKDSGRPVTIGTIRRELEIVRAILNWGVKRGYLTKNPMAGFVMPRRNPTKVTPPTQAEYDKILSCAAPHCQRLMLITYYTGLRPGKEEAFCLTWDSVDMETDTITIVSAVKGGIPVRMVPINKSLKKYLKIWKEEDKKKIGKLGYLIHYKGEQITSSMKTAWRNAKRRAGVTRPLRPYSLRHKTATDMLSAGADVGAVAEVLGHKDPSLTVEWYQEVANKTKRAAVDSLATGAPLPKVPHSKKDSKKTKS